MSERSAKDSRRRDVPPACGRATSSVLDDLVAADMINHAAGPQGREGLKSDPAHDRRRPRARSPSSSTTSSGRATSSRSTSHCTATHRASTMPLLADVAASQAAPDGLDVHAHLAGRRRDDRRALGLPRRPRACSSTCGP